MTVLPSFLPIGLMGAPANNDERVKTLHRSILAKILDFPDGRERKRIGSWRMGWDSNPRWACAHAGFQDRCLKPLGHPSLPRRAMPGQPLADRAGGPAARSVRRR